VTPRGVGLGLALSEELLRGSVAQGLMGADGVIGAFPGLQLLIELGDLERAGGDFIELLRVSTVGTLDPPVRFGRARRQDEEADAALAAGFFKDVGELTSAVDLQGAQGKRQATFERLRKQSCRRGSGATMHLDHIPARDHVARRAGVHSGGCTVRFRDAPVRTWDGLLRLDIVAGLHRPVYRLGERG